MSTSVLLLGTGPLQERDGLPFGFPQIRFWSIKKTLDAAGFQVNAIHVGHREIDGIKTINPDHKNDVETLRSLSIEADAVISAGPFLPALVASWTDTDTPVWIDWPSDPLADWNARINAMDSKQDSESEAAVIETLTASLTRADALGVISERQKWATLGQLLMLGRHQAPLHKMVHITPVAYDFPYRPQPRRHQREGENIRVILCGTVNAWFDDKMATNGLSMALDKNPKLEVIWTGGPVYGHYEAGWTRIEKWAVTKGDRVKAIRRPNATELAKLIASCHVGIWCDKQGVEPLLGSRTRALFMAWMGLDLMGTTQCELSLELAKKGFLTPINSAEELAGILIEQKRPISVKNDTSRHRELLDLFGPKKAYSPLLKWVENPEVTDSNAVGTESLIAENRRLRQSLAEIHNSPTWRAGAKLGSIRKKIRFNPGKEKK